MKNTSLLFAILTPLSLVHAQQNKAIGSCSPIIVTNKGTLDIHCTGLDPAVAKQISLIVTQVSSIKKSMATEATQQQMLRILEDVQHQLDGLVAQQPKRLAFPTDRIDDFIRAFKKVNAGASVQGLDVEVAYEFKVRSVGQTLMQAFQAAGVPAHASISQGINFFGAERGIFISYLGEKGKALHFIDATGAGLSEAGVIDDKLPLIGANPMDNDKTMIQIFIKN